MHSKYISTKVHFPGFVTPYMDVISEKGRSAGTELIHCPLGIQSALWNTLYIQRGCVPTIYRFLKDSPFSKYARPQWIL